MLPSRSLRILIIALASLAIMVAPLFAQARETAIGDQPGFIPSAADEQLAPARAESVMECRRHPVCAPHSLIVAARHSGGSA
jgi:hypothetical protein